MAQHVRVREVGPRDGLQMASAGMETSAKVGWIGDLVRAGVHEIEVGSFVSPRVIPQMADTESVARDISVWQDLRASALVPNLRGAQQASASGIERIMMPVSVSESHSRANVNKSTEAAIEEVRRVACWVREAAPRMHLEAGCATAFGCSIEGVVTESRVVDVAMRLVEAGADSIILADTVGYGDPMAVRRRVSMVRSAIGDRLQGLHLHDTMGLGLANVLAGIESGVRLFDASLAGLGGCPYAPGASGNIVTEDLVFMLHQMGFCTGIDLEKLIVARQWLTSKLSSVPLVGQVAKAGLPRNYRPLTPESENSRAR